MNSWQISRRTMLRGVGAALALPLLDLMTPLAADEPEPALPKFRPTRHPTRMLMMNLPNGTYHKEWEPKTPGPLGELPPMLVPLQAHVGDITLLSNLWNQSSTVDTIGHFCNEANFFTGVAAKKTTGADVNVGGVSMDQVVARCTGALTRFPSLHLNLQAPVGGADTGWARMYGNQLSWSSPTTPVPNEVDPKRAFDRLFRTPGQKPSASGVPLSQEDRTSVLDYVRTDANALKRRAGIADQRKLDEYLTAVRDVERQLDREMKELAKERRVDPAATRAVARFAENLSDSGTVANGGQYSQQVGRDHTRRTRLMLDLIVLGFWTDSTRVATFMFGNERNDINYSFIDGVKGTHHEVSHYNDPAKLAQYRKINLWHAEQVAYVLGKMKEIKETNGGSLLDNSLVFWGGTLSDGNTHGKENLPIMLAGRGGGGIKPGRFIAMPRRTPLCNLYLSMFQAMGVQAESFADSTGIIRELTA